MLKRLREYHQETRGPVYALLFILPFLLVYEAGLLWMHRAGAVVGPVNWADQQLRRLLGVNAAWAPVLLLGAFFLAWIVRRRPSWRVRPRYFGGMLGESLLYSLPLLGLSLLHAAGKLAAAAAASPAPSPTPGATTSAAGGAGRDLFAQLALGCGAGVFEEFVFRLLLVSLLALVFVWILRERRIHAGLLAATLAGLVFSLVHRPFALTDPPLAEAERWWLFIFRALAGTYLGLLFFFRGFGLAAGAHALYNVQVILIDAWRAPDG